MRNIEEYRNDPEWHTYWFENGGPSMDDEQTASLFNDFKNPHVSTVKSHLFITIALPDLPTEIELKREKVFEHINKIQNMKYKYLKNKTCHFTLEFNSFDKKLKVYKENYHIHILIPVKIRNFTRSRIIRDFSRLFKVESNFVDVIYHNSKELFETRLEYIQNQKNNPEKEEAVQKDIEERKSIRIENYYSHTIL